MSRHFSSSLMAAQNGSAPGGNVQETELQACCARHAMRAEEYLSTFQVTSVLQAALERSTLKKIEGRQPDVFKRFLDCYDEGRA